MLFEALHSHQQACCAIRRRLDMLMGDSVCSTQSIVQYHRQRSFSGPAREHDIFKGSTGFQYMIETSIPRAIDKAAPALVPRHSLTVGEATGGEAPHRSPLTKVCSPGLLCELRTHNARCGLSALSGRCSCCFGHRPAPGCHGAKMETRYIAFCVLMQAGCACWASSAVQHCLTVAGNRRRQSGWGSRLPPGVSF